MELLQQLMVSVTGGHIASIYNHTGAHMLIKLINTVFPELLSPSPSATGPAERQTLHSGAPWRKYIRSRAL